MTQPKPKVKGGKRGVAAAVSAIIAMVFVLEGGYVNHPSDPGGATNWGITERTARRCGYTGDMRELPQSVAFDCYRRLYIEAPGFLPLVEIDPVVAEEVIDTGVNMGPRRPSRFFQRAVARECQVNLPIDGVVGPITVDVWEECRRNQGAGVCVRVLNSLDAQQEAEYDRLVRVNPKLRVFRKGWQNHRIGNVDRSRCDA